MQKIPHNQGIMTGTETEYGHDAISDIVLRNPIKGYPTMGAGGCLPDMATMSSPRVRKGKGRNIGKVISEDMDHRGNVHRSTPLM